MSCECLLAAASLLLCPGMLCAYHNIYQQHAEPRVHPRTYDKGLLWKSIPLHYTLTVSSRLHQLLPEMEKWKYSFEHSQGVYSVILISDISWCTYYFILANKLQASKFMLSFKNDLLPPSFKRICTSNIEVHSHYTRSYWSLIPHYENQS